LLREKIVASASDRMIVIADETKLVETLGRFPLPIEVNRFGLKATELEIAAGAYMLGLDGTSQFEDDARRAICYRRRPSHHRRIFWPHSGRKSAVRCAARHSRRCRTWSIFGAGGSGGYRRSARDS
jgi:hypothetical protein